MNLQCVQRLACILEQGLDSVERVPIVGVPLIGRYPRSKVSLDIARRYNRDRCTAHEVGAGRHVVGTRWIRPGWSAMCGALPLYSLVTGDSLSRLCLFVFEIALFTVYEDESGPPGMGTQHLFHSFISKSFAWR